jgi:hypothetical protein
VHVHTPARSHGIGLSVRPARVDDFYAVDSALLRPGETGWLVSPLADLQVSRRDHIEWFAAKTGIDHIDEGDLTDLARRVIRGGP